MRNIAYLMGLFVLLGNISISQTDTSNVSKTEFEFTIQTDKNWQQSEGEKLLTLTIKNNSAGRIILKEADNQPERNYLVELKNLKGEIVSLSDAGKSLTGRRRPEISVIYVKLNPGEEITRTLDLSKLYSLEENEKYTISVTKSVYVEDNQSYQKLRSNIIESP